MFNTFSVDISKPDMVRDLRLEPFERIPMSAMPEVDIERD